MVLFVAPLVFVAHIIHIYIINILTPPPLSLSPSLSLSPTLPPSCSRLPPSPVPRATAQVYAVLVDGVGAVGEMSRVMDLVGSLSSTFHIYCDLSAATATATAASSAASASASAAASSAVAASVAAKATHSTGTAYSSAYSTQHRATDPTPLALDLLLNREVTWQASASALLDRLTAIVGYEVRVTAYYHYIPWVKITNLIILLYAPHLTSPHSFTLSIRTSLWSFGQPWARCRRLCERWHLCL